MVTHPRNRPHCVNSETGSFLFTLYKLLFEAKVDLRIKQRTFETAADSKNSWRVVSISQDALHHISQNRSTKGLQRGHILSRSTRAEYLFLCDAPLTQNELLMYFFEHDTVALVTKSENNKDGTLHWSQLHEVPAGLFTAGSFSIYARKGKELVWVDQVLPTSAA
jgi:hypothetical protein